jgi:hypothetical protein
MSIHSGSVGLFLTEVVRPVYPLDPCEQPFGIWRFRPLVTLEDDITTYFAELLDTPVRIGEEA